MVLAFIDRIVAMAITSKALVKRESLATSSLLAQMVAQARLSGANHALPPTSISFSTYASVHVV
jgi:hypothetical protein